MASRRHSANGEGSTFWDGDYAVHKWKDPITGKYTKRKFKTMQEAKKYKRERLNLRDSGITVGKDIALADFLYKWLEEKDLGSPMSQLDYEATVRNYIIPHLGKKITVRELQIRHVTEMMNKLKNQKKRNTDKVLAPRTVNHVRGVLRTALNDAMRQDLVERNVAQLATPIKGVKRHQFNWVELKNLDAFDNAVKGHPLGAMFMLAVRTGMRAGELVGLRWSDIDFDNQQINLKYQVQRYGGRWIVKNIKKDDDLIGRDIPMADDVLFILKQHLRNQAEAIESFGIDWAYQIKDEISFNGDHALVFTRGDGNPLHQASASQDLKKLTAAAGLPTVTLHDLRRSTISNLQASGVPTVVTAAVVGHSDTRLTDNVYTAVNTDAKRDALGVMSTRIREAI